MRKQCLLFLFLALAGLAQAQGVKGKLLDLVDNKPLAGATLTLMGLKDTTKMYNTYSDSTGSFFFQDITADSFFLRVSSIGYEDFKQIIGVKDSVLNLGSLLIPKSIVQLGGITVLGKTAPAVQKGDTTQYSASQFKVNPDATVEDLVKKMPGITVDRDGTVTAQGEQVRKVTIDGRDFFGDDASAALRNLPSEIVDKIQVFDKLSEQAQLTGVDDGNAQRAINIITRAGMRNGQFGRLFAGIGTDSRYQVGGNASFFKDNRRVSFVGLTNNINQQNFASQDLLGLTSSGGNRGGGGNPGGGGNRGGGPGGGGGNFGGGNQGNFTVGQQSGINKTNAIGINYSDKWGKKADVSGSYFFNNSKTNNNRLSGTQSFIKADSTLFFNDTSFSQTDNYNHRVNFRMEYKFDSANTLIISPNIGFQKNNANSSIFSSSFYDGINGLQSESRSMTKSNNSGFNINNNIVFRHSFPKRGRSFSINLNTSFNKREGDTWIESINKYYNSGNFSDSVQQYSNNQTNGRTISSNIVYTEPIGKTGQLQFNFNPSFTKNKADRVTYQFDETSAKYSVFDTVLSNKFDNYNNTQNGGITYRIGDRDNQFSVGVNYQHSSLKSDQVFPDITQVRKSFSDLLTNIQYRKKLSARSNIRIFYRGSVNAPSVTQLQNVIDNTNQLRMSTGNPELNQQYMHVLSGRYTFTNTKLGQSFFANLFMQRANNYLANATFTASSDSILVPGITLFKGSQLTKPVNLDGYWSLRSFFTYGQPVNFIKSNLNLNAGFSYSRIPGLVNSVSTTSNSFNYSYGAVISSNISEYIDFNVSYTGNYSVVKNSLQPQLDQNYRTAVAGLQMNLLTKSGWFFQNDLNYQSYNGLSEGFNQNFWLWNAGIGKKFLKDNKGELKLSVFDLLKQNQSITRTVGDSYIQDVQNLVLRQYFMLTFTYNLKNFGKAPVSNNRQRD